MKGKERIIYEFEHATLSKLCTKRVLEEDLPTGFYVKINLEGLGNWGFKAGCYDGSV